MKDILFAELVTSVSEGGVILRGEKKPSRVFVIAAPNQHTESGIPARALREKGEHE